MKKLNIAIVGGGVAGASLALYLGKIGLDITLFEKESSLVNGPPFCHLHAGGNLYREISDQQCIKLLKQSIDFLRFYPFIVDYRPTVIVLPKSDSGSLDKILLRLELLKKEYEAIINLDPDNKVLGESSEYYKIYNREQIEKLKQQPIVDQPNSCDDWMIPVSKNIDTDKVQFPLIMVQEYGLNLFRLASASSLAIKNIPNINLQTETNVTNVKKKSDKSWQITYQKDNKEYQENFDYLINAAGFRSGKIDDMIDVECERMVEFKAAYISKCENFKKILFPEIIFHGERGTPQGMGQFTPYPNGYFQLHGMTKDITLYDDGLVANSKFSCQPKLKESFIKKIEKSWSREEIDQRTSNAIKHLSQFIPNFSKASVGSKPLFGAQQIPGNDPTLRVAEVSFPTKYYARCEIVKVSSVLDMIDAIVEDFIKLGYVDKKFYKNRDYNYIENLVEREIKERATAICKEREYPISLANRNISK